MRVCLVIIHPMGSEWGIPTGVLVLVGVLIVGFIAAGLALYRGNPFGGDDEDT